MSKAAPSRSQSVWAQTQSLVRPYFLRSSQRSSAWALAIAVLALAVFTSYWFTRINQWSGTKVDALQTKNRAAFYALLPDFFLLVCVLIVAVVGSFFLAELLEIRWRRWMSKQFLQRWLSHRAFYQLELLRHHSAAEVPDNPDQRIQEDVQRFVSHTCTLAMGLVTSLASLAAFGVLLMGIDDGPDLFISGRSVNIPGFLFWVALLYCGAGSATTYWLGRALKQMNFELQKREANFRYHLARVRDNAESIALDRAEAVEHAQLDHKLESLLDSKYALVKRQVRMDWFINFFSNLSIVFPYLVLAQRYFDGHITMGALMQAAGAFAMVQTALSWFINNFAKLAEWRASVQRLADLDVALTRAGEANELEHQQAGTDFKLDGLQLWLPTGRVLLDASSATIQPGQNLLISGPSGCGKSTLLRALAGIWPFARGRISVPNDVMFIPQHPYFPEGRLRDALAYPVAAENYTEEQLAQALEQVGLPALQPRLDDVQAWQSLLSGGEKQRLAVARVLLKQPTWVIADEASSALDNASEARVYEALTEMTQRQGGGVISVAHRDSVRKYHEQVWQLSPQFRRFQSFERDDFA